MTIRLRSWARDLVLVAFALCVGWWMRSADRAVMAQTGSSDNLAFQMIGTGPDSTLAMYNPGTRTLYVYARAGSGSSNVTGTYGFLVNTPGMPLVRRNCPAGEF